MALSPASPQQPIKPDEIVGILLRYRWLVVLPLCISLTAGLYLALTIPRVYSASTTILVQGQKVPGSYVKSIVTSGIDERINTISQQIMSHTNLEGIIQRFGLFQQENHKKMFPEDKVKILRERIQVKLTRARNGTDAFSIVYRGTDPERVMNITNTLAGLYMDENLKLREAQAVGTSEFLDAELEKTRKKLVEKESALSAYRSKYMGGLPDELESNLRTLDRLQEQLIDRQGMLQDTRNAIAVLDSRMARPAETLTSAPAMADVGAGGSNKQPGPVLTADTAARLTRAEMELDELLLRYTDKHPDVVKKRATITRLKNRLKMKAASADAAATAIADDVDTPSAGTTAAVVTGPMTPERKADLRQLRQLEGEAAQLRQDVNRIKERMALYQGRVDETPRREQELRSLERDYGNIQDVYSSLLDRKLEAELSVNMERKQKGEQFRILDAARRPQRPISPDVRKLFVLSMGAGVAVGGGIIFLLVFLDGTIRRDEDIEAETGLPILAHLGHLRKKRDRVRDGLKLALFIALTGYVVLLLAGFAVLDMKGV